MLQPVTWQLSRQQKINPAAHSSAVAPTFKLLVVATWLGSWCSATSVILELTAGAPIVDIDIYGFLPADAGKIVAEGDVLLRMEDVTTWQVMRVGSFPSRTIVMLATATEKRTINP